MRSRDAYGLRTRHAGWRSPHGHKTSYACALGHVSHAGARSSSNGAAHTTREMHTRIARGAHGKCICASRAARTSPGSPMAALGASARPYLRSRDACRLAHVEWGAAATGHAHAHAHRARTHTERVSSGVGPPVSGAPMRAPASRRRAACGSVTACVAYSRMHIRIRGVSAKAYNRRARACLRPRRVHVVQREAAIGEHRDEQTPGAVQGEPRARRAAVLELQLPRAGALHQATSHHIRSDHITRALGPPRKGTRQLVESHHITSHHAPPHHIAPHHITPHHTTPHHTTPHHTKPHHTTPHHTTSHHTASHHITPHHTTPHHTTPHHTTPHHTTSHHITPHHTTPHHTTPHHTSTSPLPHVTTAPRHHCPTAPLPHVTTAPRHHCPTSPLPHVTTAPRHHCPTSPLPQKQKQKQIQNILVTQVKPATSC